MTASSVLETNQKIGDSLADAWGSFDRIYCISLAQRADRRQRAQQEFERVGLGARVEFVTVHSHPTNSEQGIFESHISCLRAGVAAGAQNIVIFEDDILFHRFSPQVLDRSIQFMKSNADWHMFFFGCFVWSSRKTPFRSILRVRYRCTAHAYVVNRSFAEKLVELPWTGVAYDDLLSSMKDGQTYACYPSFAFQSASATDNDRQFWVDRARRLVGGLRRLQRWNEFTSRHTVSLILAHVAIVLLSIVIILLYRMARVR
jgi:GR25 family glycosyltransferase involved in LPS biosynthesis